MQNDVGRTRPALGGRARAGAVRALAAATPTEVADKRGWTALHCAALHGHIKACAALIYDADASKESRRQARPPADRPDDDDADAGAGEVEPPRRPSEEQDGEERGWRRWRQADRGGCRSKGASQTGADADGAVSGVVRARESDRGGSPRSWRGCWSSVRRRARTELVGLARYPRSRVVVVDVRLLYQICAVPSAVFNAMPLSWYRRVQSRQHKWCRMRNRWRQRAQTALGGGVLRRRLDPTRTLRPSQAAAEPLMATSGATRPGD